MAAAGGISAVSRPSGRVRASPPSDSAALMLAVSAPALALEGVIRQAKVAGRPVSSVEVRAWSGTMS